MEVLIKAAGTGRYGQRDRTLLLLMYRRGLRVGEAINLRWDQFDLKAGYIAVQRLKNSLDSSPGGAELRALRQLQREWPDSPYLFESERGGPMTARCERQMHATAALSSHSRKSRGAASSH